MFAIKEFDDFPLNETDDPEITLESILAEAKQFDAAAEEASPVKQQKQKKKKSHRAMRITAIMLSIILFLESAYCVFAFSDLPFCVYLRNMYIDTALETFTHQWLAYDFLPKYIVDERAEKKQLLGISQVGHNSERDEPTQPPADNSGSTQSPSADTQTPDLSSKESFYEMFWELNRSSFEAYLDKHPEVLENGWENIYINEAGLNDDGTDIYTSMGEQVLAIDVANKILIVRVEGSGYLGALAVCKDPAQLRCEASEGIGRYGQKVGTIVDNSGGVLGISASGFDDPNGAGNGGVIAGYAMCEGKQHGYHYTQYGYKRIELASDNKLYIIDSYLPVADDVTDACEFTPALIIDGEYAIGGWASWNANNPRACLGQSEKGEILMLVIEGRQIGRSIGTTVEECAKIMMRHDAYTAMNLDGGTSAVMYYNGEYVTNCSNQSIDSRRVPNAWVYGNYE